MGSIKTLAELATADDRSLRFTPYGFSTGGTLAAEAAAEFQQSMVAHCDLHADVPDDTRKSFDRIRSLHAYGLFYYEAYTIADDLAWLVLEQALRERFVAFYGGVIPLTRAKGAESRPLTVTSFDAVDAAFRPGGSHRSGGDWVLSLPGNATMKFRATMAQLLAWARAVQILDGQRNKKLDAVYLAMRNAVAHPHHHVSMPSDSARTINDLAEIINRLWGHRTPGGRLYPAPLARDVLFIAWADDGVTRTLVRADQLDDFALEPRDLADEQVWTCVAVLASEHDDGVWNFDARYERTTYPADYLWGPGRPADALAWMAATQPTADNAAYLDRLFCLRNHAGRTSLARRPEVALALEGEERAGNWFVVRADFPIDAFGHVRHIRNGIGCGITGPDPQAVGSPDPNENQATCPVELLFEGSWDSMAGLLAQNVGTPSATIASSARVPPRLAFEVASDVEAD